MVRIVSNDLEEYWNSKDKEILEFLINTPHVKQQLKQALLKNGLKISTVTSVTEEAVIVKQTPESTETLYSGKFSDSKINIKLPAELFEINNELVSYHPLSGVMYSVTIKVHPIITLSTINFVNSMFPDQLEKEYEYSGEAEVEAPLEELDNRIKFTNKRKNSKIIITREISATPMYTIPITLTIKLRMGDADELQ